MGDPWKDTMEVFGDVPIEPPREGRAGESPETDLPGDGEGPDVDSETKARLRAKVAGDQQRQENAELGLSVDEDDEGTT